MFRRTRLILAVFGIIISVSVSATVTSSAAGWAATTCSGLFEETWPQTSTSSPLTLRGNLFKLLRRTLALRYDVRVNGLDEALARGNQKIVFLFEHPALIDPVVLYSQVGDPFNNPRPVVASSQNTGLKKIPFRFLRALFVPEVTKDSGDLRNSVVELQNEIINGLEQGQNFAIAPSGQLKRTHLEDLRTKSMVADIIKKLPRDARVILVTSKGLWGSSFSYGSTGAAPSGPALTGDLLWGLVTNGLKKRQVDLTFDEVDPSRLETLKDQNRAEINEFLQSKINQIEQDNVYVPLVACRPNCRLPDPVQESQRTEQESNAIATAAESIPGEFRSKFINSLTELFPEQAETIGKVLSENSRLSEQLGLDSLGFQELLINLEKKMGVQLNDVQDWSAKEVLLQIYKSSIGGPKLEAKKAIDVRWFRYYQSPDNLRIPEGGNVLEVLYKKARENPEATWMADEKSGVLSYRDAITKIMILSRVIGKFPGESIGLMLPPSVGGTLLYFATLQAGKTPVMVNYTAGNESLKYSMDLVQVKTVLTSQEFTLKLKQKNLGVNGIADRFIYTEDLMKAHQEKSWRNALNLAMNLLNRERGRFTSLWPQGKALTPEDPAVILFTSGSSSLPKAVVLSNKNLMTNVRDVAPIFNFKQSDSLTGFAPSFHSLGLTGTLVMPALLGLRVNYFPDATNGKEIGKSVETFRSSMIIGPPNLLRQIFQSSTLDQLSSLRFVLTGAEQLSPDTAEVLKKMAPGAIVLEGAGATETSPVWAVNPIDDVRLGYVGKIMPSITFDIVDNESLSSAIVQKKSSLVQSIAPDAEGNRRGELILSGDSVITSYYNNLKPGSFIEIGGRTYYRTEDLVTVTRDGYVKIEGRFSRQHKASGGEMINHAMIERVLAKIPLLQPGPDGKPTVYIGAAKLASGKTVTTLLTTKDVSIEDLNREVISAYSPVWSIRRMVRVSEIPLLGTGKVDSRQCNAIIAADVANQPE